MQRFAQVMAALALLVSGGLWAKPTQAVDAQPAAKNGTANPWPFGDTGKCACAFCSGKARIGAQQADHTQL